MKKSYRIGIGVVGIVAIFGVFTAYKVYATSSIKNSVIFADMTIPYVLEYSRDIKSEDIFHVKEGVDKSQIQVTFEFDKENVGREQSGFVRLIMGKEEMKRSFPLIIRDSYPVEYEYTGKTTIKKGEKFDILDGLKVYDYVGKNFDKKYIDFRKEFSYLKMSGKITGEVDTSKEGMYKVEFQATDGHGVTVMDTIEITVE